MKTALDILNKEAPIFQQDFDTELRDRCVVAMESFAAQSVREDRESRCNRYPLSKVNNVYMIDVEGVQYVVANPHLITHYCDGSHWPGEVTSSFRKMVEPCKVARKCLEGEVKGNENCKRECQLKHMSEELYVDLLPYVNLPTNKGHDKYTEETI